MHFYVLKNSSISWKQKIAKNINKAFAEKGVQKSVQGNDANVYLAISQQAPQCTMLLPGGAATLTISRLEARSWSFLLTLQCASQPGCHRTKLKTCSLITIQLFLCSQLFSHSCRWQRSPKTSCIESLSFSVWQGKDYLWDLSQESSFGGFLGCTTFELFLPSRLWKLPCFLDPR